MPLRLAAWEGDFGRDDPTRKPVYRPAAVPV